MEKNTIIFTTKYVIEYKYLITDVIHDTDGDWQFFSKEDDTSSESARVISLGEILILDPSVEAVLWIPAGTKAWRSEVEDEWSTGDIR